MSTLGFVKHGCCIAALKHAGAAKSVSRSSVPGSCNTPYACAAACTQTISSRTRASERRGDCGSPRRTRRPRRDTGADGVAEHLSRVSHQNLCSELVAKRGPSIRSMCATAYSYITCDACMIGVRPRPRPRACPRARGLGVERTGADGWLGRSLRERTPGGDPQPRKTPDHTLPFCIEPTMITCVIIQ